MFHRILVPVDGSELSERAVPVAEQLAQAQGAELVVVRVAEPFPWVGYEPVGYASAEVYQNMVDEQEQDCRDCLRKVAEQAQSAGVTVRTELLRGPAAAALLDGEKEIQPDLVVMASHGRTGLVRFALGSVADIMVRLGVAPVLLVRSFNPVGSPLKAALVPLDGSALAEGVLPIVEALAGHPLKRVRLLRAVEDPLDAADAAAYLSRVARRLQAAGLEVSTKVELGTPAPAIEHAAAGMDLVILSTHGRGGFDRLAHGSVANAITQQLSIPVLLARASRATPPDGAVKSGAAQAV